MSPERHNSLRMRTISGSQSQPTLVLVVDDNDDQRELYRDYLEAEGYLVETARDGVAALRSAAARPPALIVMDLGLPIMDGWEATRRLKANPATARIPVVALTGFTPNRDDTTHGGWDAFVTKPCLPEELVACVKSTLYDRERAIG